MSDRFSWIFQQLFSIEIPDGLSVDKDHVMVNVINTKFMSNFKIAPICQPVQLLLRPLVKYFRLFFYTESKVNKISKPEWYMTQVMQWITVHQPVLAVLLNDAALEIVDGRTEFLRGLVVMVMEKVQKDLELISKNFRMNDDLFFHLIEESLSMTMDVRRSFDYPRSFPDPIDVICYYEDTFDNWMKLEQRFAAKQLDEVFRSATCWKSLSSQCKRVECVTSFMGVIDIMKERIHCLFDVSKQAMFCEVLLDVIGDFRRRLLQISKDYNAKSQRWCDVMNVLFCVKMLLRAWRLDQMFIAIQDHNETARMGDLHSAASLDDKGGLVAANVQPDRGGKAAAPLPNASLYWSRTRALEEMKTCSDRSVFAPVLGLYQHVLEEMGEQCIESAFEDISERADSYTRGTCWLLPESAGAAGAASASARLMSLSPSASEMLLMLRDRLHELERALEPDLFELVWQGLAARVNELLYRHLIRGNRFNAAGALQLEFDLRRNLLPLFLPYTRTPERFFVRCVEACLLLTLRPGTALLVRQVLAEALQEPGSAVRLARARPDCPIRALSEVGVLTLGIEEAQFVLALRVDIGENLAARRD